MKSRDVGLRFECGSEDRMSQDYGPFPYAQLEHDLLTIGPDGDELAGYEDGYWRFCEGADKHGISAEDIARKWSDVVIYGL